MNKELTVKGGDSVPSFTLHNRQEFEGGEVRFSSAGPINIQCQIFAGSGFVFSCSLIIAGGKQ